VALPIEQQVNGVEDSCTCSPIRGPTAPYSLTVTFKIGTDLNFAQVLVQNRVSSALSQLRNRCRTRASRSRRSRTSILCS